MKSLLKRQNKDLKYFLLSINKSHRTTSHSGLNLSNFCIWDESVKIINEIEQHSKSKICLKVEETIWDNKSIYSIFLSKYFFSLYSYRWWKCKTPRSSFSFTHQGLLTSRKYKVDASMLEHFMLVSTILQLKSDSYVIRSKTD